MSTKKHDLDSFDYPLRDELIAQTPAEQRDHCRLLVVDREQGTWQDRYFYDLTTLLSPGDVLVANETRVRAARLQGVKRESGGAVEVLLLRPFNASEGDQQFFWEALVKPGRRLKPSPNTIIDFYSSDHQLALSAKVVDWSPSGGKGERILQLIEQEKPLNEALNDVGSLPLPPYIHGYRGDQELYQTVYSQQASSAAAPTAGLHFTPHLIKQLQQKGVLWSTIDLEVGLDTFRPVTEEFAEDHIIHSEVYSLSEKTAEVVNKALEEHRRIIAVGTTSVRALESAFDAGTGGVLPCQRKATSLFIIPGYQFNVVGGLITNFHVPRSTLMMLVSAFAGETLIQKTYAHALETSYRFLSFGDAMFIA